MSATDVEGTHATLRWLPIAHGALTIVFGLLLLVVPDRTLTFVAVLAGVSLLAAGAIDLVQGSRRGLSGAPRVARLLTAILALVAGVVVIARPDESVKVVALVTGFYLIVSGAAQFVLAVRGPDRRHSMMHGAIGLLAGIALIAWPDVSVGVLAALLGVYLLMIGAAELVFGLMLRRPHHAT